MTRTLPRRDPSPRRSRLRTVAAVACTVVLCLTACSATQSPTVELAVPKPNAVFFGLNVPNSSPEEVAKIAASVGETPTVASLFVKLNSPWNAASLVRIAGPTGTPFITLEPWLSGMRSPAVHEPTFTLASVIDGSHDAELAAIAHKIADYGRPVYLRLAHEMNGNWYPWAGAVNTNQPAQYPAFWRHVYNLFQPITGRQVHWVFSPAAVQSVATSAPTIAQLYPGDAYVDYLGLSGYNRGVATAAQTLQPTITELSALSDKPIILSEIGSSGPRKAAWVASLARFIEANPRIRGFVYFSTSPTTTGATGDYRIDSDPETTAAFRNLVHTVPLASTGDPGS